MAGNQFGRHRGLQRLIAGKQAGEAETIAAHAFGGALQHKEDSSQVDREHPVPLRLSDIEQRPDFSYSRVVEQYVEAAPELIRVVEHALDVCRPGHIRLDGSLPKLVGKSLCAVAFHIRQQQPRAFACQAPRRCGTDAARSARDERMNAGEAISHLADRFQGRRPGIAPQPAQRPGGSPSRL